jgi:hypothetical protein
MELIATLVYSINKAKKIMKQVPNNSIVLFPESVMIPSYIVRYYSEKKNLYVIYNDDYKVNGKFYITMKGVDKGKLKWMVHKYYLWKSDVKVGWNRPPELAPIVKI